MKAAPSNARLAAAELLTAILDEGRALDDALNESPHFNALQGRDRGFARAMASAALRRLGGIDAVLAQYLAKPLPETAFLARALLRVGAAQILALGTPAHAAVAETVQAANNARETFGFAKLMNAVLRKVASEGIAQFEALPPGADLPAWLFTRWRSVYGDETANTIALALREEPPLDLTVKIDAEGWAARLLAAQTPTNALRITPAPSDVTALPGFAEGAWWVQDAAAALPAKLLGNVHGLNVLDLCAAPGGKTLQLAANGANVTAVDVSRERLSRLEENLARTGLSAKVVAADVLKLNIREPFDAVLLDAPCTSTGTLRRHPDVAWLRRPDDVRTLSALQSRLLDKAASFVKPDGALIYAVCSLEPEEGPGVVEAALQSGAWRRAPLTNEVPAEFITSGGDLRTLPSHWPDIGGLDGFYAARLIRA